MLTAKSLFRQTTRWLLLFSLIAVAASDAAAQGQRHRHPPEQLAFSAEDNGVEHPVPVPKDVLAILSHDEGVQSVLEDENIKPENLPSSWFSASIAHLSTAKRSDLVVVGQPPVSGANVTSFWVFRATAHGHELVLYAPAHDLIIKNTRWKGYRDIEFAGMTAAEITTVLCHFDGRRYRAYRTKAEPIQ